MEWSAECGVASAECDESRHVRQLRTPHAALRIGSMSLLDRVRALLGSDALLESAGPDGVPRVAPDSPDAVALLLGTAREEGWRVRIEGAGTWMPSDAPCDLALTTRRLDRVQQIEADPRLGGGRQVLGLDRRHAVEAARRGFGRRHRDDGPPAPGVRAGPGPPAR